MDLLFLVRFRRRRRSATTFQLSGKTPEANFFKPHEVNLWVWENFWHPFRWPLVNVTKLPKQGRIYLVPTIKWEPLIQSLQNLVGIITLVTLSTWLNLIKFWNGGTNLSQLDDTLTRVSLTLTCDLDRWPWIFKLKLYLGNGRPDCDGTKGTGVDRMPGCETLRKLVNCTLRWPGYLWPWPLTKNLQGQIVSWQWEARLSWNERDGSRRMPWCKTLGKWVNWTLRWLGHLWPWPLILNFQGQIASREWEAQLSWNERDGSQ